MIYTLLGSFFALFILSSCSPMTILEKENSIIENEITRPDDINIYLERDFYSYNELDEMFYVIENNTNQPINTIEFYMIDYYSDGKWIPVNNNQFWDFDKYIEVLPNETVEIPFWLSVDSTSFEPGDYRFRTRITYPENDFDEEDLYIAFEIN